MWLYETGFFLWALGETEVIGDRFFAVNNSRLVGLAHASLILGRAPTIIPTLFPSVPCRARTPQAGPGHDLCFYRFAEVDLMYESALTRIAPAVVAGTFW